MLRATTNKPVHSKALPEQKFITDDSVVSIKNLVKEALAGVDINRQTLWQVLTSYLHPIHNSHRYDEIIRTLKNPLSQPINKTDPGYKHWLNYRGLYHLAQRHYLLNKKKQRELKNRAASDFQQAAAAGSTWAKYELAALNLNSSSKKGRHSAFNLLDESIREGCLTAKVRRAEALLEPWARYPKEKELRKKMEVATFWGQHEKFIKYTGESSKITQQRYKEARKLMQDAITGGHPYAMYKVAGYHQEGLHGYEENYTLAVQLYNDSANLGYPDAMHKLGVMHTKPSNGQRNLQQAVYWLSQGVIFGNASSGLQLIELINNATAADIHLMVTELKKLHSQNTRHELFSQLISTHITENTRKHSPRLMSGAQQSTSFSQSPSAFESNNKPQPNAATNTKQKATIALGPN